ncbi:hypothetical protein V3C99_017399 [Haemonchus contortus]
MGGLKGRYMIDACSITKYRRPTSSTIDRYPVLVLPSYQEQIQFGMQQTLKFTDDMFHLLT